MKILENIFNPPSKKLRRGIEENRIELVKEALAEGASPNQKYKDELLIVKAQENLEIVKLLIGSGANINFSFSSIGITPLYSAAAKGLVETVKIMLTSGANVNHINNIGSTALITAARNGHLDVVKILLEAGANVDLGEESLFNSPPTALTSASKMNHYEIVKVLLEKGANVNLTFTCGNAYSIAEENKSQDMVGLIKKFGGKVPAQKEKSEAFINMVGGKEVFKDIVKKAAKDAGATYSIENRVSKEQHGFDERLFQKLDILEENRKLAQKKAFVGFFAWPIGLIIGAIISSFVDIIGGLTMLAGFVYSAVTYGIGDSAKSKLKRFLKENCYHFERILGREVKVKESGPALEALFDELEKTLNLRNITKLPDDNEPNDFV